MGLLSRPENRRLTENEIALRSRVGHAEFRRRQNEVPGERLVKAIVDVTGRAKETVFGKTPEFDPRRREFLKKLAKAGAIVAVSGVVTGVKLSEDSSQRSKVKAAVDRVMTNPATLEVIPADVLIPEDERSGSDILFGLNPEYSLIPLYGYKFDAALEETAGPLLKALESGTTAHVTIPYGTKEEFLDLAKERYPDIKFAIYEMPISPSVGYMQDVVFATGSKSGGRFLTASSTLDRTEFKNLPVHRTSLDRPLFSIENLRDAMIDPKDVMRAIAGVNLLGDEMLAESYPDSFETRQVPVKLEGGDVDTVRLPDGRTAVMVGPWNLVNTIVNLANQAADYKLYTANEAEGFSEMSGGEFLKYYEQAREFYGRYFGDIEVIFADQEEIELRAREYTDFSLKFLLPTDFFHTDMVFKIATDANGRQVAFFTTSDGIADRQYMARICDQLEKFGYEIVPLPCGNFATLNYTNSLMYTRDGQKTVIVPQYGIAQDDEAVRVYESRGFKVIKADLSNITEWPSYKLRNLGSVHCRAEILF